MPYAHVAEGRIFYAYLRNSRQDAAHLILIHGAGGNHQLWGSMMRNLNAAHVYALDLPGHGRSTGTGRRSISDYASIVLHFMDVLGLERAVIAGHSMGSAMALQMALNYPQRVWGLILVGSGARLRVLPAVLDGLLSDYEGAVGLICESAYSSHAPRGLVRQGQRQMLLVPAQITYDDFAACNAFDVMPRLSEIHCPTLVICGTEDRLTPPKSAVFLTEKIAGAEIQLIDDAGHMVMTEKPELVGEAIEATLTRWQLS